MITRIAQLLLAGVCVLQFAPEAQAADSPRMKILNAGTNLRRLFVYRTPVVIGADGKFKTAMTPYRKKKPVAIPEFQSPLPPANWRTLEFSDAQWGQGRVMIIKDRGRATGRKLSALHTATRNSIICARAEFVVDDPAKVTDLKVSVVYVGGAALYVNGTEIARGHLPKGELKPDTLAGKYPDDFLVEAGKYVEPPKKFNNLPKAYDVAYRRLVDIAVPSKLLRKGQNVLAIELYRAPTNEAATKAKRGVHYGMYVVYGLYPYLALKSVEMSAAPGSALQPNTGRPQSVQVWNCRSFDTLATDSCGDPGEKIVPIKISGARNGVFAGRFVVSSDKPIEGLKIALSPLELKEGKGKLPASAAKLFYARQATPDVVLRRPAHLFDGLVAGIPATVPLAQKSRGHDSPGAVLPVWIRLRVPADAVPGEYQGDVTVEAKGLAKTTIPVRLAVSEWALAKPIDFRVTNLSVFSPHALARHYGVPTWSDRHFELIGQSIKLMSEVNARRLDVELILDVRGRHKTARPEESMVRWIKKPDGKGYTYDFTIVERYFDVIEKNAATPLPLLINCWGSINRKAPGKWSFESDVALYDPETKTYAKLKQPGWDDVEAMKAFWKPVLDELRKRIEKRGWWKYVAISHQSYCWAPPPQLVDLAHSIWPDATWGFTAHNGRLNGAFKGSKGLRMSAKYTECVWNEGKLRKRIPERIIAPRKAIWNSTGRNAHKNDSPLTTLLWIPETMLMRGHDGLGYLVADAFPIRNPKRKGRYYYLDLGRGGVLGGSTRSLLAPHKQQGIITSERYEMFRQGVQCGEAVLFLERALRSKKLSAEMTKTVNDYLNARSVILHARRLSEREDCDRDLYTLTGKVARALSK
jgi:Glycoside hydrolase 123, catalytic domain